MDNSNRKVFFTPQRIETIVTTLFLLGLASAIQLLSYFNILAYDEPFATGMLLSTATYIFGGCVLQTMGHRRIAIAVGAIVFFILCIFLFYSVSLVDFTIFFLCMALVIRKSSHICECSSDGCIIITKSK